LEGFINRNQNTKGLFTNFFLSDKFKLFILPVLINVILFSLLFLFIYVRYQTNDDSGIEAVVSGIKMGEPSEYLVVINIVLGKILVLLYSNFPNVNWYPIMLYLLHFLSFTIILHCILKKKNLMSLSIYLLVFSLFELFLLANLQFTTTAAVTGISGMLLVFTYIDSKDLSFYSAISMGIIFLVIAGLVRKNILYMILGLSSVYLLIKLIRKPGLRIPVIIAIIIAIFSLFNIYNNYYYNKDAQWDFYMGYNQLRGKIIDYPRFEYSKLNKDIYDDVGWSENDVEMFDNWFFADLKLYSIEKLEYVVENIKPEIKNNRIFKTLKEAWNSISLEIRVFTLVFLIFMIMDIIRSRNKYLFSVLISSLLIIVYFSFLGRLPDRVFIPIILFFILSGIIFIKPLRLRPFSNTKKIAIKITIFSFCIIIVMLLFISTACKSRVYKTDQEDFENVVAELIEKDKIYIRWGSAQVYDRIIFFHVPHHLKRFKTINLGWRTHSPIYNQSLEKYSIDNLYKDIIERDDIYVITKKDRVENYVLFMFEHFGETIKYEKIDDYYGLYSIYKFYSKSNQVRNLLKRAYRFSTGEEIRDPTLSDYLKSLDNNSAELPQVLEAIIFDRGSKIRSKDSEDFIKLIYLILLDREADNSGLEKWLSELESGKNYLEVFNAILGAHEFKMKYDLIE